MYRISKSKLSLAMLNAGLGSAKDLAQVSGVSVNTISRSMNGGSVKLLTIGTLAKALNVNPMDLAED